MQFLALPKLAGLDAFDALAEVGLASSPGRLKPDSPRPPIRSISRRASPSPGLAADHTGSTSCFPCETVVGAKTGVFTAAKHARF